VVKLFFGLLIAFCLFQILGETLGSERGQAGVPIALLIIGFLLFYRQIAFGEGVREAGESLGLSAPNLRGLVVSSLVSLILLAVVPVFAIVTSTKIEFRDVTLWTMPGLFAQAGIAEEVLFRGYLFGQIRKSRSYWRAAFLSAIPFVIVHFILFFTMPFPIAAAALLLAVVISFPLAYLYEIGGRTIWAPALLHFVVQGAIKLVTIQEDSFEGLAMVWMGASAVIPSVVFAWRVEAGER